MCMLVFLKNTETPLRGPQNDLQYEIYEILKNLNNINNTTLLLLLLLLLL